METKAPVMDREARKRIGNVKRAQTRLKKKYEELERARGSASRERMDQLSRERRRLAIGVMKAVNDANSFITGLDRLLEWKK